MGDALYSAEFLDSYGIDLKIHLLALYADPRGWNLRNRFAHGTMDVGQMHLGVTVWLIQSLLLLSVTAAKVPVQVDD